MQLFHCGDDPSLREDAKMATATHRGMAIGVLLLATFMDLLDVTMVQVALPAVGADLQAAQDSLDWVSPATCLPSPWG